MINSKENYLYQIEISEIIWLYAKNNELRLKMCLQIICLIYMYKKDLALENIQWLMCDKTSPKLILFLTLQYIWSKVSLHGRYLIKDYFLKFYLILFSTYITCIYNMHKYNK